MNFDIGATSESSKANKKLLSTGLIEDQDSTFDGGRDSKSSYYRETSTFSPVEDSTDPGVLLKRYETTISQKYSLYFGIIWMGLLLSLTLIIIYFIEHTGIWLIMMCILELFSVYTWIAGINAKKEMEYESQHSFLSFLFVVVIIKCVMSCLAVYSLVTWEDDAVAGESEESLANRLQTIDFTIIFGFTQLAISLYAYFKGKKLAGILEERKKTMEIRYQTHNNHMATL